MSKLNINNNLPVFWLFPISWDYIKNTSDHPLIVCKGFTLWLSNKIYSQTSHGIHSDKPTERSLILLWKVGCHANGIWVICSALCLPSRRPAMDSDLPNINSLTTASQSGCLDVIIVLNALFPFPKTRSLFSQLSWIFTWIFFFSILSDDLGTTQPSTLPDKLAELKFVLLWSSHCCAMDWEIGPRKQKHWTVN